MNDSDRRLGDPLDLPHEINKQSAATTTEPVIRRAGDSGLGIPEFEPEKSRPLSDDEKRNHRKKTEEQLRLKAESMLLELEQDDGWKLPATIRRFCSMALIVLAAVLGLFLVTETLQFTATVQSLPSWGRWLALSGLILFGGLLALVLLNILWSLARLHRSPRIHLRSMKALAERRQMQVIAAEKQSEARKLLEKYLREYPTARKDRKRMLALGMTDQEWNGLLTAKDRLLEASRPLTPGEWLDDFQREFQELLDDVARRRVKQYAFRIGAGTATSSIAIVDQMIVLYGCTAVVKDLFAVYHLRPAFGQTVVILARGVVQTYLSGMIEEAAENAVDFTADSLKDVLGEGTGFLTSTVGRAISAKAAEAALNGYLLQRLGKRAIAQLQPVSC
ncbi:MAG: DUF697 domain-containing protein [Pontiellaceae bacterium]|nr:DUF697 domain-containing protein [Pontiellaceae bacterium]